MNKSRRKKYPTFTDFHFDDINYGLGAPFVGIGLYTNDRQFSWPDPQGTTKEEHLRWMAHLRKQGYAVPKNLLKAYVDMSDYEP